MRSPFPALDCQPDATNETITCSLSHFRRYATAALHRADLGASCYWRQNQYCFLFGETCRVARLVPPSSLRQCLHLNQQPR
ncbi:hypothetical protein E2C01_051255 [Portunus trituberculatus]|uniref:Uncharacterized protein n=1 Tax=Portunus trituberculatus TaxID=210409 RepID=A0A5B7GJT1_PORTR|nr:hypothetical protein [Portunus trituberculatus]